MIKTDTDFSIKAHVVSIRKNCSICNLLLESIFITICKLVYLGMRMSCKQKTLSISNSLEFLALLLQIFQLVMNYFKTRSDKHVDFKKNLINQMVAYSPDAPIRSSQNADKLSLFRLFCIYCLFVLEKQELLL